MNSVESNNSVEMKDIVMPLCKGNEAIQAKEFSPNEIIG